MIGTGGLIGIDIKGIQQLVISLQSLPGEVMDEVAVDVLSYMKNVFQQYPSQKYVTRAAAYGVTFFTDRQRRWFFAALASGEIDVPYQRTQGLRNSWQLIGDNREAILVNESPGAEFVMGDNTQSRHEAAVGWLELEKIIHEREDQITRRGEASAKKVIKRLGL